MGDQRPPAAKECRSCRHFRNDAAAIEAAFAGLTSLSSGFGSVRADDGICLRHDRYLSARCFCPDYSLATAHLETAAGRPDRAAPRGEAFRALQTSRK